MYSWFLLKCNFFPILFDCIVIYQTRQLPPHGRSKIREESMQKKSKTQITINWEKKLRKSRCVELQNVISGKRSDLRIFFSPVNLSQKCFAKRENILLIKSHQSPDAEKMNGARTQEKRVLNILAAKPPSASLSRCELRSDVQDHIKENNVKVWRFVIPHNLQFKKYTCRYLFNHFHEAACIYFKCSLIGQKWQNWGHCLKSRLWKSSF